MTTEVISVRVDKQIIETIRKSGADPKREVKQYLYALARFIKKKEIAKELIESSKKSTVDRGMVVKWIREDRER